MCAKNWFKAKKYAKMLHANKRRHFLPLWKKIQTESSQGWGEKGKMCALSERTQRNNYLKADLGAFCTFVQQSAIWLIGSKRGGTHAACQLWHLCFHSYSSRRSLSLEMARILSLRFFFPWATFPFFFFLSFGCCIEFSFTASRRN